ncbi:MAG: hypoxanthine phosphoribosyltransferase [Culturomica sp.]|jgi:hypoxanthine phosphoribosyltransferase|nr:hypoxanthine phosphoribosyltransferase [Culturomica sp.]
MQSITLHDKTFELFLEAPVIDRAIGKMAEQMNRELAGSNPLFLGILNGAFMFASDLMKQITIPGSELCFLKIASYRGTSSGGEIRELIGLDRDPAGRTVVILEDVVDTGKSMQYLLELLKQKEVETIRVASLFFKPKSLICQVPVDYYGLELENDFVVGRGLDYDGLGRNLPDLYKLSK